MADRDSGRVSKDLKDLYKVDIIEFEEQVQGKYLV